MEPPTFTVADADRMRIWFDAIEDLNPGYLETADLELCLKALGLLKSSAKSEIDRDFYTQQLNKYQQKLAALDRAERGCLSCQHVAESTTPAYWENPAEYSWQCNSQDNEIDWDLLLESFDEDSQELAVAAAKNCANYRRKQSLTRSKIAIM